MNNYLFKNSIRFVFLTYMVLLSTPIILCGCHSVKGADEKQMGKQLDFLYHNYLTGNADQARESLLEYLELIPKIKPPLGQAYNYVFAYSRLYVLETRVGNGDLATVYFVKAEYWRIKECEASNMGENDIADATKLMTTNTCLLSVDNWDRSHNDGRIPNYAAAYSY